MDHSPVEFSAVEESSGVGCSSLILGDWTFLSAIVVLEIFLTDLILHYLKLMETQSQGETSFTELGGVDGSKPNDSIYVARVKKLLFRRMLVGGFFWAVFTVLISKATSFSKMQWSIVACVVPRLLLQWGSVFLVSFSSIPLAEQLAMWIAPLTNNCHYKNRSNIS